MEESNKVDILNKKRPTVNELKIEVIRLRKDLDKSNADLNHYKYTYEKVSKDCEELKAKNQYNSSAFIIATIIALGAVITMILRLV